MTAPRNDVRTLARLLRQLPEHCYVTMRLGRVNSDGAPDHGSRVLTACVMEEPPDGGWPSRGAMFRHREDMPSHLEPCLPQFQFDPIPRDGISVDPEDGEEFARLLCGMLRDFVARERKAGSR